MIAGQPLDFLEIDATVRRMEARLIGSEAPETVRLAHAYHAIERRFAEDLGDPRDVALSCGAAPMVIQYLVEHRRATPPKRG
jgi:hypothetical protein